MSFIPHMPCPTCDAVRSELNHRVEQVRSLESKLSSAEKEVTEAEDDARQWAKQLDQQVRVNRGDKAKVKDLESRLEAALEWLDGDDSDSGALSMKAAAHLREILTGSVVEKPETHCERDADCVRGWGHGGLCETELQAD